MTATLRVTKHCVLTAVFFGLITACGGSYNAEKAFWQLTREHGKTMSEPAEASEKDFKKAAESIKELIQKYPKWSRSAGIQFNLAEMYSLRDDLAGAREEFMKVVMNFPEEPEICARSRFIMGVLMEKQRKHKEALSDYEQIKVQYPETFTGLQLPIYLATYYKKRGMEIESEREYREAVRIYKNTIEMNPYSKRVTVLQYLMMIAYGSQERWVDLVEMLHGLAERYPKSKAAPVALYRIAEVYRVKLGDFKSAKYYYNKISGDYPDSDMEKIARYSIGGLSLNEGDIDKAREEFERIREAHPDDVAMNASARFAVAMGYERAGKMNEAIKEYKNVKEGYPWSIESLRSSMAIALYYHKEGQVVDSGYAFKSVIKKCNEMLIKSPNRFISAVAQEYKAEVYIKLEDWTKAIKELDILMEEYPEDPRAAAALYNKALIYDKELNDKEKAIVLYNEFVKKYPGHKLSSIISKRIKEVIK